MIRVGSRSRGRKCATEQGGDVACSSEAASAIVDDDASEQTRLVDSGGVGARSAGSSWGSPPRTPTDPCLPN